MSLEPLGPASSTWNDYVGTAAADDARVLLGSPSLYELAGLDRGCWRVVGADIEVRSGSPEVTVYAVDLEQADGDGHDIEEIIEKHGQVPVTAIQLADPHVEAFFDQAFRRVVVRLVSKGLRDEALVIQQRVSVAELTDGADRH